MNTEDVYSILRDYPQVYQACHVDHLTRSSAPRGLTWPDSSLMAHIEAMGEARPGDLARHLGVSPSTLSPALRRLADLGYVSVTKSPADARRQLLALTPAGREVMAESSVLNRSLVAALLDQLTAEEAAAAVRGLRLLALGAQRLRNKGA